MGDFRKSSCWVLAALLIINPYVYESVAVASESAAVRSTNSPGEGQDNYIKQNITGQNNGTAATFVVQSRTNQNWRSLVQFRLVGAVPAGSAVKSGVVSLWQTGGTAGRTFHMHPVTESWDEVQSTWINRQTGPTLTWTNQGGTFGAAVSSATTVTVTAGQQVQRDFTGIPASLIEGWIANASTNFGFLLKDANEGNATTVNGSFASREFLTSTVRPLITISYMRDIALAAATAPTPSQINLSWTFPSGSTASHYDGVLITGVAGASAPTGTPTDTTAYSLGAALGTGLVVANTNSFSTLSTTLENGDLVSIAPGTQYTFKGFTHDSANLYAAGVSSSSVTTPSSGGASDWSYATGASTLAPPAPTGSGTVIAGGNDNFVRAMNYGTGVKNFTPGTGIGDTGGAIQDRPTVIPRDFTSNPTCLLVCDVILGSSSDGRVHAIRADTGAELWQSPVLTSGGGPLVGSPAVQLSNFATAGYPHTFDLVIVGTRNSGAGSGSNNAVYGINGNTGAIVWTFSPGNMDFVNSTPYIDYASNTAWVTSYSNGGTQPSIWRLDTKAAGPAGVQVAAITLSTSNKNIPGPATVNETYDFVYALTEGGDIVAISSATNTQAGSAAVGGTGVGFPLVAAFGTGSDSVFVSTSTGVHKRTFDRTTQTFGAGWDNGSIPNPSVGTFSAYPALDAVYVGSSNGNLYKVLTASGTATSVVVNAAATIGSPGYDEGISKIYVGDSSGHIYSFSIF